MLRAAEDLKIAGLTSKTNGHNNSSNGVATISEAHQRNGNATSVSALGQVSVPNGLTNGHHSSNGTSPDALQPLGNVMPGTNQRRPSGGSNSSGSKTGSGRKKSQPKNCVELSVHWKILILTGKKKLKLMRKRASTF